MDVMRPEIAAGLFRDGPLSAVPAIGNRKGVAAATRNPLARMLHSVQHDISRVMPDRAGRALAQLSSVPTNLACVGRCWRWEYTADGPRLIGAFGSLPILGE
jgi:hypothetical protein